MAYNILVTGAGGFVGGSIIASLLKKKRTVPDDFRIFAAVRQHRHLTRLAKFDLTVLELDLVDSAAVTATVLDKQIDIVVHAAGLIDPSMAANLIHALAERQQQGARETFYIHTSSAGLFGPEAGWPADVVADTDDLLKTEVELVKQQPAFKTDVVIGQGARAGGVSIVNIPIPMVYGESDGEIKKLSIKLPALIRASLKHRKVYKFDVDTHQPAVHISDLTDLYIQILVGLRHGTLKPARGRVTYFFPVAHTVPWWKTMDLLADAMASRSLLEPTTDTQATIWPSYDYAADSLGFPRSLIRFMGLARGHLRPVNSKELGWKPLWNEERFLASLGDEVDAVLASQEATTTAFDTLMER